MSPPDHPTNHTTSSGLSITEHYKSNQFNNKIFLLIKSFYYINLIILDLANHTNSPFKSFYKYKSHPPTQSFRQSHSKFFRSNYFLFNQLYHSTEQQMNLFTNPILFNISNNLTNYTIQPVKSGNK